MSELYDKLKDYWKDKLGKYGDELITEHGKELKAYSIVSIEDVIEQLEQNKFRLESYSKTAWSKILDIAHLKEYMRPDYIKDALKITTHQPALGQGEFLFVSCFKNLGISKESGDLVDLNTNEKIEFKGNRSSFSGEDKDKYKYKKMTDDTLYSICSLFDHIENKDTSLDAEFCKLIDTKLKEQPEHIDKVIELTQNIESTENNKTASHSLTKMFGDLYRKYHDLQHVVAAMHCYTYLKLQKTNWLVITNDNGFMIFEAPMDAEDAWTIVKQLKIGSWNTQNKGIEISL